MKSVVFLLALCCISFALIDPPVQEVDQYDRSIAPQGILHQNFLNYSEKAPTLDDPTTFFYVKILTLTPSVNMSISSDQDLHPALIWMVTENHSPTVTESYGNGSCDEETITRDYGDMRVENITAYYTLDGLRQQAGNETLYNTASRTVLLADNSSGAFGASDVPFRPSALCSFMSALSGYVLGSMINLSCYDESLAYASPYGSGVYNLTARNMTIVNPHLNVTLVGVFTLDYTEQGTQEHMDGQECRSDSWSTNGTLTLTSSDFASYEIQNDYLTLLPYLPGMFSLNGNTSETVLYHVSLLSNSNLYKYYSKMDNQTAGAYYLYSFNVTRDGYGTRFITATQTNQSGLLPQDPQSQDNYGGAHNILYFIQGSGLRSPTEFNALAYNYSRIYDLEEVFYNVSDGEHHAELDFYTWFGNYTVPSDINVSSRTVMTLYAYPADGNTSAVCTLMSRGAPVAGEPVYLRMSNQTVTALTNGLGMCTATFDASAATVFANFDGTPTLLPSSANYVVSGLVVPPATATDFSMDDFGLLLFLSALFAFSFLNLARSFGIYGEGATVGDAFNRFFPPTRKQGEGRATLKGKAHTWTAPAVKAVPKATGDPAGKKPADGAAGVAPPDAEKGARELKAKRELSEKEGRPR